VTLQYTRIVADENVPKEVVDALKAMGLREVYWIAERRPGMADPDVWRLAAAKQALLLTGDVCFLPQLNERDVLDGPDVVEYSTNGFTKNELQDPLVMGFLVDWFFRNEHHASYEHVRILVEGRVRTRRQVWQYEKARRRGLP